MAENKTNVMRILERAKVEYTPLFYTAPEGFSDGLQIAEKLNLPPEFVYKTLVTRGGHDFFVFVIPILCELDLKKAAKAVGQKSLDMIHVSEINKITGYVRGGCSPLGMKKAFVTVFDTSAKELEYIYVSAGKIGAQIKVNPHDLLRLSNAKFEEVVR